MSVLHSIRKRLTRLRRFPLLVERRGATFLLDPQNWIDNRLIAGAPYEDAQLANALRMIEQNRLDLVVDIGANFGLYSILLGKLDPIRDVIAFEPVRRNHAQLMANVFANRLERKVEAHRLGLSDAADRIAIHIDPTSTGVSRRDIASSGRDPSVFTENEEIELARFDDMVSLTGRRAFVKIDVEGQAAQVVSGMTRFLAANACALQVEIADAGESKARDILRDLNYEELTVIDRDAIFVRRDMR